MLALRVRPARPELRPFVRIFVQRNIGSAAAQFFEPTTAQLEHILTFDFGTPVECWWPDGRVQKVETASVAGAQTQFACHLNLRAGVESFGIFLQPTGLALLFGVPVHELTNRVVDANAVIERSIHMLWNRLAECSSFDQRVAIAEEFLMDQAARAHPHTTITAAANYIFHKCGVVGIADVCDRTAIRRRQLERKFRQELGVSPKVFARVARFQSALDAKISAPTRTWLDIAHSFGYHDQMHMIHDFKAFGQRSPTTLVSQIGDNRPPALATPGEADTLAYLIAPERSDQL